MAKINWQDIGELQGVDQNSINKAIVIPAKEALRQTRFALGGNLTIRDNMYAAVVTFSVTHGVEYTFQNPLKTTPVGFQPILSKESDGTVGLACASASLNLARTDGLLGLTVSFAPPHGILRLRRTSAQSITDSASAANGVAIAWPTIDTSVGAAFSFTASDSDITCNFDGFVSVAASVAFVNNATGRRLAWAQTGSLNINGRRPAGESAAPNATVVPSVHVVGTVPVVVGDTLKVVGYQSSGGALNTSDPTYAHLSYLSTSASYTANVTGILWGG